MSGDWNKADHYLQEVQAMLERKQTNFVVSKKMTIYLNFELESSFNNLCVSIKKKKTISRK